MVFSYFVTYKSYHNKGTLDFKQRMVKERSELLQPTSTLMQTIHKQLYERRSSQLYIEATTKSFLFLTAKVAQFHSVKGTEISHMKK